MLLSRRSRRQVLQGVGLAGMAVLASCGPLSTQAPLPKVRRIGYLDPDSVSTNTNAAVLRQALQDLGYTDGTNLRIEYRFADGQAGRLPALAAELVALPVEVIVAGNTVAAEVAHRATTTIPIVTSSGNTVAAGLVTNIAHPEGNITGVTTNSVELVGKWVQLLAEAVPDLRRLAALADPNSPVAEPHLREAERAATVLQLQLVPADLRDLQDLPATLATLKTMGAEGVLIVPGGVFRAAWEQTGSVVLNAGLPGVAETDRFARGGGLLAYGTSMAGRARLAATYIDKLLKGAKPGDLPIEQPTTFDSLVNLKAAQTLGRTLPRSVLEQATEVIQ